MQMRCAKRVLLFWLLRFILRMAWWLATGSLACLAAETVPATDALAHAQHPQHFLLFLQAQEQWQGRPAWDRMISTYDLVPSKAALPHFQLQHHPLFYSSPIARSDETSPVVSTDSSDSYIRGPVPGRGPVPSFLQHSDGAHCRSKILSSGRCSDC